MLTYMLGSMRVLEINLWRRCNKLYLFPLFISSLLGSQPLELVPVVLTDVHLEAGLVLVLLVAEKSHHCKHISKTVGDKSEIIYSSSYLIDDCSRQSLLTE